MVYQVAAIRGKLASRGKLALGRSNWSLREASGAETSFFIEWITVAPVRVGAEGAAGLAVGLAAVALGTAIARSSADVADHLVSVVETDGGSCRGQARSWACLSAQRAGRFGVDPSGDRDELP